MDWSHALFIDFESRSELDVRDVGPHVYFEHPSTSLLCAAWAIGPDAEPQLWTPREDPPYEWRAHDWTWVAHNKDFEACAFALGIELAPSLGSPGVYPEKWIDTAVLCAVAGLPRNLEDAAKALGLPEGKLSGNAMHQLCKPRKATKTRPAGFIPKEERPDLYEELYVYCARDVKVMQQVVKRLPPAAWLLPPKEQALEQLTDKMNARGIPIDLPNARRAKAEVDAQIERLMPEWIELMGDISPRSPVKVAAALGLPNVAADTVRDAMKTFTGDKLRILEIRADVTRSSVAKLDSIFERTTSDSKVHGAMVFNGAARTGRWSSMGLQVHNFPQGCGDDTDDLFAMLEAGALADLYKNPIAAISSGLKGMIEGPLWSGDFSQIEPRVLNKLAGDEAALNVFRTKGDPYRRLASRIYGVTAEQVTSKDTTDARGKVVKSQRFVGKTGELGCGYGLGARGFQGQMKAKYDVDLTEDQARNVVTAYRELHPKVVALWRAVEALVKNALQAQVQTFWTSPGCPGIAARTYRAWLCVRLPSGRILWYFEPSLEAGDYGLEIHYWGNDPLTHQWTRVKTYGGKLVENITQAVARDIMAEAMIRLEARGERLLFTVHDEIVGLDRGTSVEQLTATMIEQPSFWKGIPLDAEVHITERYQK